ncbi:hypothetical protein IC007_0362 [Sulfuracidifex tepidarius]|uniref:Uncharacterized protein n=1 Tax=Sulfuracidifex tepidarius TaxID=1294262 RepID=A0A510E095_9CREN|nr:hypothetical protein IC007_0362 [Sulfuracidifex tepidarius]
MISTATLDLASTSSFGLSKTTLRKALSFLTTNLASLILQIM